MDIDAERHRRLSTVFAATIEAVPEDRWASPSPCEDWTARDVVGHVVDVHAMMERLVGRSLIPGPGIEADPYAAYTHVAGQVQAHLDDPETAEVEFDGFGGRKTFASAVDGFLCIDLIVHRWDVARATGLDETIAENDLAWVRTRIEELGDMMQASGQFGPAIEIASDASEQDKVLGLLGRRP